MSRGGIGKSKKQEPAPPRRRTRRTRTPRERAEQKPRPGLAAGIGGIMIGLSIFVLFAGLVLIADEQDGGQTALSLGLATLPLGFATVALLSQNTPVIKQTLFAYIVAVFASSAILLGIGLTGFGAFFTAVTVGVGLGGVVALRQPAESSRRVRLIAVAGVSAVVLAAELVGVVVVALIGPFAVMPAINLADTRAIMKAAAEP